MQFRHQAQTPLASCGGSVVRLSFSTVARCFVQCLLEVDVFFKTLVWIKLNFWNQAWNKVQEPLVTLHPMGWYIFFTGRRVSVDIVISHPLLHQTIRLTWLLTSWMGGWFRVGGQWVERPCYVTPYRDWLLYTWPSEGLWSVPRSERAHETLWMWTRNRAVQLQQLVNFLIAWHSLTTCFKQ